MPSHPSQTQSQVQVRTQERTPQSSSSGSSVRGRAHQPLKGHLGCIPAGLHLKDASTAGFQILPHPPIFHSPHPGSTEPCGIFMLGHRQPNLPSFHKCEGSRSKASWQHSRKYSSIPIAHRQLSSPGLENPERPPWQVQNEPKAGPHTRVNNTTNSQARSSSGCWSFCVDQKYLPQETNCTCLHDQKEYIHIKIYKKGI